MAQAQAQAQKQATISYTESLELSIFHISYLRGMFPESAFNLVEMRNLDGMQIRMLNAVCDQSQRLINWVEKGVYDAIKRGYIKGLYFGIATDTSGNEVLEEYIFSFNYSEDDGHVSMDVSLKGAKGGKSSVKGLQANSVDTIKYQVTRLMRMLVQICQTLDAVPQQRFLFMKLTYHEHTPDDYEPPFFGPVSNGTGVGHFPRRPFTMEVGKVTTAHHNLSMKVKSVLDCCPDDDEEDMGVGEAEGGGEKTSARDGDTDHQQCTSHPQQVGLSDEEHEQEVPADADVKEQYQTVKAYVMRMLESYGQVGMTDAMVAFPDCAPALLESIFNKLKREGVVLKKGSETDSYHAGPALKHMQEMQKDGMAANALADKLQGQLGCSNVKKAAMASDATAGDDEQVNNNDTAQHDQHKKPSRQDAQTGAGRKTVPTTKGSAAAPAAAAVPAAVDGAAAAAEDMQVDAPKTRARKASFVTSPIYQHKNKKSRAQPTVSTSRSLRTRN